MRPSSATRLAATFAAALVCAAGTTPAHALDAAEVFQRTSPSVWAVRALDAQQKPIGFGSAVVIAPGRVVTACHVLARAKSIELRRENQVYEARLESPDVERDLCMLSAPQLRAPPARVAAGSTRIGQHVYAVHYPQGLGITLGEGLISGVGSEDPQLPPIQTTAVLPPGSAGGGLFDEQGMLVAITTLVPKSAQAGAGLHFARPASWIAEVAQRAEAQLSKRAAAPSGTSASTDLPAVGSSWKYSYRDRRYPGPQRIFTVRVTGVVGSEVQELTSVEGGSTYASLTNAKGFLFSGRRLVGDAVATELAPYIQPPVLARLVSDPSRPEGYPAKGKWTISEAAVENDAAVVGAGTFKTVKVMVSGSVARYGSANIAASDLLEPVRFRYTAWYAAETHRYVQTRHETWNRINDQLGDEFVELLEYKRK